MNTYLYLSPRTPAGTCERADGVGPCRHAYIAENPCSTDSDVHEAIGIRTFFRCSYTWVRMRMQVQHACARLQIYIPILHVYTCVSVCVCVCVYLHSMCRRVFATYKCMCVRVYTPCIRGYLYICLCVCRCLYILHSSASLYICIYTHTLMHVCVCVCMCVHTPCMRTSADVQLALPAHLHNVSDAEVPIVTLPLSPA